MKSSLSPILLSATVLLLAILACSLPTSSPQADPNAFNTAVALTAQGRPTIPPPVTAPASTQSGAPVPAGTASDLPFHIDCTALDPARQPDCDAYLAATRDRVYPLMRELTGTSLSSCYDGVYYTIVTDEQLSEYQGEADENHITWALRGSLDAAPAPLYDPHELLHTTTFCSGALDQHIFHGAFERYINLTLAGSEWNPGRDLVATWLETKLLPGLQTAGDATPAPGAGGHASVDACMEIYGDLVTILYYDSGIETVKGLYRATINPGPEYDPNARLLALFGPSVGRQFQAVVNALKQNPKYPLEVPECGLE
ncbi:MAG: hypothetical protein QMD04_11845 [Anaerolineales bacterium]|nr:hypothetical protein [Anaerolineales bacterium]